MTRILSSLFLAFCAVLVQAQVAPSATYILFNSQNMDILDYRPAYSNSTTKYYAYNFRTGGNDQYILYSGTGVNMDYLPNNSVNSSSFSITDDIVTGVNGVKRQMFVVLQQQRGYIIAPITNITKVTTSGKYIFVNALNYSYVFDTDNISMGRELSTAGSASSVSLNSFGYQSCKYQYSFKRTPNVANAELAEFEFIPGIGIVSEKSGRNASEMQANQVNLWSINGLPLSDFIAKECGNNNNVTQYTPPTPVPMPGSVVPSIDPQLGSPQTGTTVTPPANTTNNNQLVYLSAISKYPAVNCGKNADAGMHMVQPKETVNSIARFYGVTAAQILKWNNIKDGNKISVCQELRITAPGGKVSKGLQPIITGTAPTTTPVVTPPPAPVNPPTYAPTQPATPSPAPGMFVGSGGAPSYQSPQPLPNPTVVAPPTAPVTTPAAGAQYYDVRPGEGVAVIARKFGYTEERFRSMNNFPTTGNVPLQVGQKVKVAECEVYHSPAAGGFIPPANGTGLPQLTQPVGNNTPTPAPTGLPTGTYQPLPPLTSSTTPAPGTTPGFVPVNNLPVGTQPAVTTPTEPAKINKRDPIGFKDYFVKDSETIKDIARKQGFDAAELALINGRTQDEKLAPGTRIQLPIY